MGAECSDEAQIGHPHLGAHIEDDGARGRLAAEQNLTAPAQRLIRL